MKLFFCPLIFLFSSLALGEEGKTLDDAKLKVEETAQKIENVLDNTRARREQKDYVGLINYAPLDLIIPSKLGLTIGYVSSADTTWELEYLRGSVSAPFIVGDLGSMKDQRISIIRRSYVGNNSFNIGYGLSYFDFKVNLGSDILSRLSSGAVPSIDLLQIQALGFNLSVGNRWQISKNVTLGVDWVSWSQPVVVTKEESVFLDYVTSPEDRDNVDTAMKSVSYFPRFSFLKIQFGMSF